MFVKLYKFKVIFCLFYHREIKIPKKKIPYVFRQKHSLTSLLVISRNTVLLGTHIVFSHANCGKDLDMPIPTEMITYMYSVVTDILLHRWFFVIFLRTVVLCFLQMLTAFISCVVNNVHFVISI